jgi:hypothetical protein
MLIAACYLILQGGAIHYLTGNVVKEKDSTYLISTADGYYEFPKEMCEVKPYRKKNEKR